MTKFATPLIPQATGPVAYNHGLGKVPEIVVGVLVCVVADPTTGRQPGDEVQCSCFTQDGTSTPDSLSGSAALFGANATQIFVNTDFFNVLPAADLNSVYGPTPDPLNFRMRVYAIAL